MNGAMLRNLLDGLGGRRRAARAGRALPGREGLWRPSRAGSVAVLRGRESASHRAELLLHAGGRVAAPGGGRRPDWSILRPDVVVGDAAGNPMNIAMVIGAYAALCRADGAAFRFPGPATVYDGVFAQVTDAHALARASLWARPRSARNQAFNYVHEPFRWRRIWEQSARRSACRSGRRCRCASPPTWPTRRRCGSGWSPKQGPRDDGLRQAVGWGFGDFVFHRPSISCPTWARSAGRVHENGRQRRGLLAAIRRLQASRVLPR